MNTITLKPTETSEKAIKLNMLICLRNLLISQKSSLKYIIDLEEATIVLLPYLDIQKKYINIKGCGERYEYISNLIIDINKSIYKKCEHNFVKDDIDTGPESSMRIEYCSVCEMNK